MSTQLMREQVLLRKAPEPAVAPPTRATPVTAAGPKQRASMLRPAIVAISKVRESHQSPCHAVLPCGNHSRKHRTHRTLACRKRGQGLPKSRRRSRPSRVLAFWRSTAVMRTTPDPHFRRISQAMHLQLSRSASQAYQHVHISCPLCPRQRGHNRLSRLHVTLATTAGAWSALAAVTAAGEIQP